MSKMYKHVLDIVAKANPDECKKMILSISKEHPSIVVRAWNEPNEEVIRAVRYVNHADGKIAAIQKHRELTGSSLLNAKNFVEAAFYP